MCPPSTAATAMHRQGLNILSRLTCSGRCVARTQLGSAGLVREPAGVGAGQVRLEVAAGRDNPYGATGMRYNCYGTYLLETGAGRWPEGRRRFVSSSAPTQRSAQPAAWNDSDSDPEADSPPPSRGQGAHVLLGCGRHVEALVG